MDGTKMLLDVFRSLFGFGDFQRIYPIIFPTEESSMQSNFIS